MTYSRTSLTWIIKETAALASLAMFISAVSLWALGIG